MAKRRVRALAIWIQGSSRSDGYFLFYFPPYLRVPISSISNYEIVEVIEFMKLNAARALFEERQAWIIV